MFLLIAWFEYENSINNCCLVTDWNAFTSIAEVKKIDVQYSIYWSLSLILILNYYMCDMSSTPSLISPTMFEACDKWLKETFYLLFLSKYLISHYNLQPIDVKFPKRTASGIVWVYARLLIKHSNIMRCIKDAWCHQLTAVVSHAPWPIVISSDRDSFVYKVTTRHINKNKK